ncbi:Uncharacterized protein APZ42_023358 [Daphnia magna]|uniref:Uncharacterized protein n=1 Tax=Daphnia magna TaxID=35525 RepID=A0A164V0U7_9CRUS|nr:Uncharacterized protein APZ42_023358 [Daphnia magna]
MFYRRGETRRVSSLNDPTHIRPSKTSENAESKIIGIGHSIQLNKQIKLSIKRKFSRSSISRPSIDGRLAAKVIWLACGQPQSRK